LSFDFEGVADLRWGVVLMRRKTLLYILESYDNFSRFFSLD